MKMPIKGNVTVVAAPTFLKVDEAVSFFNYDGSGVHMIRIDEDKFRSTLPPAWNDDWEYHYGHQVAYTVEYSREHRKEGETAIIVVSPKKRVRDRLAELNIEYYYLMPDESMLRNEIARFRNIVAELVDLNTMKPKDETFLATHEVNFDTLESYLNSGAYKILCKEKSSGMCNKLVVDMDLRTWVHINVHGGL